MSDDPVLSEETHAEIRRHIREQIVNEMRERAEREMLADRAGQVAEESGVDSTEAFRRLTEGIGNIGQAMSQAALGTDQLGASLRSFADSIGVNWDALSEEERQQAILDETLRRGSESESQESVNIEHAVTVSSSLDQNRFNGMLRDWMGASDDSPSNTGAALAGGPLTARMQTSGDGVSWRGVSEDMPEAISGRDVRIDLPDVESVEVTAFGDTDRTFIAGLPSREIEVTGRFTSESGPHVPRQPGNSDNRVGAINGIPIFVDPAMPDGEIRMIEGGAMVNPDAFRYLRQITRTPDNEIMGDGVMVGTLAEAIEQAQTGQGDWGFHYGRGVIEKPQDGLVRKIRR